MGSAFSVGSYYRSHPIPDDWDGKPEDYEALKIVIRERMENSKELYQLLHGVQMIITRRNSAKASTEFIEYGYADLINTVIEKKYLNSDILAIATIILSHIIEASPDCGYPMVHTHKCLKTLSDVLPKLYRKSSIIQVLATMCDLGQYYGDAGDLNPDELYQRLLKLISKHSDAPSLCSSAVTVIAYTLVGRKEDNIPRFLGYGGVEAVCNLFSAYISNDTVAFACSNVLSVLSLQPASARDVVQMGGIELLVEYVRTRRDPEALAASIHALQNILWESTSTRLRALNLGLVAAVRDATGGGAQIAQYIGYSALCLATLFSVDATFKRGEERAAAVEALDYLKTRDGANKRVLHALSIINRVEDPRACGCREAGVCSRTRIDKCKEHGGFMYCEKCGVPQFMFRCATCSDPLKVYCLACKERCHKGHKGETFFFTAHCDCENKECCCPPPSHHPLSSTSLSSGNNNNNDDK